jgi:hypothetical protein
VSSALATLDWQRERAWLGYAGLLPFLVGVALLVGGRDAASMALAADLVRYYAAVIASFLGAVHWGVMTDARDSRRRARLRWGVTPALIAWLLLLLPTAPAFLGFALLFALILGVDRHLLPILDDRYRRLRLRLSAVVIACLLVAAVVVPEAAA